MSNPNPATPETTPDPAIADLTAQLAALSARAEAAEAALAASLRETRLSAVQATFAQLGRTLAPSDAEVYLALDEAVWTRVRADLLAAKPQAPEHLFGEQAVGEPAGTTGPALSLSAIYAARRGEVN
jgi:hypothetical protein